MEELQKQVQALTNEDWQTFLSWVVGDERTRREAQPAIEQAQAEVVEGLVAAGVVTGPDATTSESWTEKGTGAPAWADPGTLHTRMYLRGAVVSHQGRTWESTHPGLNHWEPGGVGIDSRIWRDITDQYQPTDPSPGEPPAGEAPAYQVGVEYQPGSRLTYEGSTYEVLQAHTSAAHWPPDQAHSLYKQI